MRSSVIIDRHFTAVAVVWSILMLILNAQTRYYGCRCFIVAPYLIHNFFFLLSIQSRILCYRKWKELWKIPPWNVSVQSKAIVTWSINGSINYCGGDHSVRLLEMGQIISRINIGTGRRRLLAKNREWITSDFFFFVHIIFCFVSKKEVIKVLHFIFFFRFVLFSMSHDIYLISESDGYSHIRNVFEFEPTE